MATQPNLDFFVHVPTRQEVAQERLTAQRGDMYTWRSGARHPVFDPHTGARCKQHRLYSPQATQHDHRAPSGSSSSSGSDFDSADETIWRAAGATAGDRRRRWKNTNFAFSPDHFKRRGSGAANAHTNTTTRGRSSDVYMPYLHDTILLCRSPDSSRPNSGTNGTPQRSSNTSQQHRTSVVLAVTYNAAESGARAVQIAEEAKNGEMLSLSSLSLAPRQHPSQKQQQQQRMSNTHAHSPTHCFEEGGDDVTAAAAAVAAGAMRSSITGAPYATVDRTARPFTASFDDEMSTPGDTRLKTTRQGQESSGGGEGRAATAPTAGAAWCATVGPTLAGRQRVLAMAEGVYKDLVSGEPQRRTALPTCELAYSLRTSYTNGSHRTTTRAATAKAGSGGGGGGGAGGSCRSHLPRSAAGTTTASLPSRMAGESCSLLGRSAIPTASPLHRQHTCHPPARQRPASATTAMSSSGMQGSSLFEKGPRRRTMTAVGPNGLAGSSFFEEVHSDRENLEGTPPLSVPAVAVSVTVAAIRRASVAKPSPPPSLHTQVVQPFMSDHSLTSSSDAVSRTMSAASPLGADGATAAGSAHLTAPPTLSQFDLELQLTESGSGTVHRSTRKSSPMAMARDGQRSSRLTITPKSDTARAHTLRQLQQQPHHSSAPPTAYGEHHKKHKEDDKKHHRRHHSKKQQQRTASARSASGHSGRSQTSPQRTLPTNADGNSTVRLPTSAKETRVYAVRMRTAFSNADASPVSAQAWREPSRRGVPVLLPDDWQLHS